MSMIYNLLRVSPSELNSYLENSDLLFDRIYQSEDEDPAQIDLDKAWDGIHCLLTGTHLFNSQNEDEDVWYTPFSLIMFPGNDGQLINKNQNMGIGFPAHYQTAEQVTRAAALLATVNLRERYQHVGSEALSQSYPFEIAGQWLESEDLPYLEYYFEQMQQFFACAAENGEAVISYIN